MNKPLLIGLVVVALIVVGVIAYQMMGGSESAVGPGSGGKPAGNELLSVGSKAPNFNYSSLNEVTGSLAENEGSKAVVLIFPAAAGSTDMARAKELNATRAENERNLEIITIIRKAPPMAGAFLKAQGITYPVVADKGQEIAKLYGVRKRPVTYFIGKDGMIADVAAPGVGDPDSTDAFEASLSKLITLKATAASAVSTAVEEVEGTIPEATPSLELSDEEMERMLQQLESQ